MYYQFDLMNGDYIMIRLNCHRKIFSTVVIQMPLLNVKFGFPFEKQNNYCSALLFNSKMITTLICLFIFRHFN